jgi:Zn finger protein HypA/HybF involved in hydrogenase expression
MRLATARDEILPLRDPRVRDNEAYLTVLVLARVVLELGELSTVDTSVVERMFAADLAFLQDLYRRVNAEGHTRAAVRCPSCAHDFAVDVAGGGLGGS